MKLSTRYIAFAVALGAAGVASAQLQVYYAYGSQHLVQLNKADYFPGGASNPAAAVGGKVEGVLRIPRMDESINGVMGGFTLQVRVKNMGSATARLQSGVFFAGMGLVDNVASNATASTDALFNAWTAGWPIVHAGGTRGTLSGSTTFNGDVRANLGSTAGDDPEVRYGPNALGGGRVLGTFRSAPAGNATRVAGITFAAGWRDPDGGDTDPVANQIDLGAGQDILLLTLNLRNKSLANFDIYGDGAGENGLSLNVGTPPSSHNFNFANNTTTAPSDLDLQAVPEPGTMLALGAGLAAVAARRRRKN